MEMQDGIKEFSFSGRIGIAQAKELDSFCRSNNTVPVTLSLDGVEAIDLSFIQVMLALKEYLGSGVSISLGGLSPDAELLLKHSGIYGHIKRLSN
jgi:anti-anti-sigma regulatory factor